MSLGDGWVSVFLTFSKEVVTKITFVTTSLVIKLYIISFNFWAYYLGLAVWAQILLSVN